MKKSSALTRLLAAFVILAISVALDNPTPARAYGGGCELEEGSRCITATQYITGYRCATEGECTTCIKKPYSICFHGSGPFHRGWRDVNAVLD